jgi:hypothetical protein
MLMMRPRRAGRWGKCWADDGKRGKGVTLKQLVAGFEGHVHEWLIVCHVDYSSIVHNHVEGFRVQALNGNL